MEKYASFCFYGDGTPESTQLLDSFSIIFSEMHIYLSWEGNATLCFDLFTHLLQ